MRLVYAYLIAFTVFLVIDLIWLGVVARTFYTSRIGDLLLDNPRWGVAFVFYAVYVIGLVYFAISPAMDSGGVQRAALNGGLFGFFAYLTYNATNLSTLKGYDGTVAIVDTLWGSVLGATVAALSIVILGLFGVIRSS